MLQKPIVYVSRITNLSDARYCAGMGVDMLGYIVDPHHEDYVSPARYQEMIGWISGPERVLEITTSKLDLHQLASEYLPDALHIPLTIINAYESLELPLILEIPFADWPTYRTKIQHFLPTVSHILITGLPKDATLKPSDNANNHPILLALDLDLGPLAPLLQKTKAQGFSLRGSRELTPGLKDYEHLSRVLEELED